MLRSFGFASVLVVVLSAPGTSAHAQYRYPAGYGGWGGWGGGGSTVQGNIASGMGNYAAGAGAYNVQTAQARSINANTAMQWNDYMYAVNKQNSATVMARLNKQQKNVNETADATYKRLHDNPEPHDIHTGDALNIVLTELANPKVYTQFVQKSTQPIDSRLVKSINFQFAAQMILISLDDISTRGVPDVLATNPAFEADRQAIRALVAKGKKEAESSNQVSTETLRSFREAVKVLQGKADSTFAQGTRQRDEVDNYLKALYGMSKMLEQPKVEQFLKGLNQYPTTTMGHLITFMQSFNLHFGVAKNPEQEAAYDQIYPMLVQLRDQSQGQGSNPVTAQAPLPDPKHATSFFSRMDYSHFQPQPDPHTGAVPAPPAPGQPR
ncbi:hypothetical protein [Singulisphaera acidiphila]|uniref:DUF4142 domain-containing protein n=1 Tax=Singulisphaera acidiphila (strain ATCC BAA-1392 / DSM 18658 / VKM B-2454 / MOB10) TaxID=886293 RepID=L0DE16_SINAD|nr:hypothetical protein [Singulisphaera acidiphila]AGA27110.1 hypothetical protein Sinac_2818 [Singulisphaera acidiphila DSM 18658]